MGSEIAIAGRGGIKTWSTHAGPDGCSVATAAAQNPIVYQYDSVETCFQQIGDDSWESEEDLLQALKAVRDDLYERFAPFRSRQKSDLSDRDIELDIDKQLALVQRVGDDVSAEDRAEALRAFRRAWWLRPT